MNESFEHDLASLSVLLRRESDEHPLRNDADRPAGEARFLEGLASLHAALEPIRKAACERVRILGHELQEEWPRSPLLTQGSILGPLNLRNREVPLTRALSWVLGGASPLNRQCLAALLERIGLTDTDLGTWRVKAECIPCAERRDGRIDIFAESRASGQVVAIEAKVLARESLGQIEKYVETIERLRGCTLTIVFLTRDRKRPALGKSKAKVVPISYGDLLDDLMRALRRHDDDPNAEFVRLLLADIARDQCNVHYGDAVSARGNPFAMLDLLERRPRRNCP